MSDLNDPRVLFAAERTLLAWLRTSLTLMAFGFVVGRFGLFVEMLGTTRLAASEVMGSLWIGFAFVLLGSLVAVAGVLQYRSALRTLKPVEIPLGYRVGIGVWLTLAVAVLGLCLSYYFLIGALRWHVE